MIMTWTEEMENNHLVATHSDTPTPEEIVRSFAHFPIGRNETVYVADVTALAAAFGGQKSRYIKLALYDDLANGKFDFEETHLMELPIAVDPTLARGTIQLRCGKYPRRTVKNAWK